MKLLITQFSSLFQYHDDDNSSISNSVRLCFYLRDWLNS
jgi:hypothetical protein